MADGGCPKLTVRWGRAGKDGYRREEEKAERAINEVYITTTPAETTDASTQVASEDLAQLLGNQRGLGERAVDILPASSLWANTAAPDLVVCMVLLLGLGPTSKR